MENWRSTILRKLEELEGFDSYSPFCRAFYRLIYRILSESDERDANVERLFAEFLDIEARRHRGISDAGEGGEIRLLDLLKIANRTREEIETFRRKLPDTISARSKSMEVVEHLLRAECHYYLGETEEVVRNLNEAAACGCRDPIIYLALGFNLYCLAVKETTVDGPEVNQRRIVDPEGFAERCHKAVEAFEQGLSGANVPFDAQLYWWIGCVSEMIGEKDEARRAFQAAVEIDPAVFGEEAGKKLADLAPSSADAVSDEEKIRLACLPAFTEEDMKRASRWLRRARTLDDLLREA